MGAFAFVDKAVGLLDFAKSQVALNGFTASGTLRALFVPVLAGLVHLAETELTGQTGAEKKAYVLEQVAKFYDEVVGPNISVFLRAIVRKAVLYVTDFVIDSFVGWLKDYASEAALKPFQK